MTSATLTRTASAADRQSAGLAAACVAAGGAALTWAVLASQGLWYRGFVSETGVPGQPWRPAYLLGLVGIGAALVVLSGALRAVAALPALALIVSGLLTGTSAAVSCSPGCPLPPYETPTLRDVVHAAASVGAVGLCALAVLLLALSRVDSPARRVSRVAIGPVVLAGLANIYGLGIVGRSVFTGLAERTLLLLLIVWCLAAALATRFSSDPPGTMG